MSKSMKDDEHSIMTVVPPHRPRLLFIHWVWVYGVEEGTSTLHPGYDKVFFTGDNIYTGAEGDLWPISAGGVSTHLPWRSGYASFAPGKYGQADAVISSTEMVWKWKQYQWDYTTQEVDPNTGQTITRYWYDWSLAHTSPTIFTRYYDGSP